MEIDTARILFTGYNLSQPLQISAISSQCYKCDFQNKGVISSAENTLILPKVDTRWPYLFFFQNNAANFSQKFHFKEHGEYTANITQIRNDDFKVYFTLNNNPMDSIFPFLMFLATLVSMAILWPLFKCVFRACKGISGSDKDYFIEMEEWEHKVDTLTRHSTHSTQNNGTLTSTNSSKENTQPGKPQPKPKSKRLRSLDTFRGIAIVVMIFVNYSGGKYYYIDHSIWNGLTVADLVFPWFIFIMGMSMQLSYKSFLKRCESKRKACAQIMFRSVKLFVIGLVLNSGKNLQTWRIPGVLQRFAVCYLVVATLNVLSSPSENKIMRWASYRRMSMFHDVLPYWFQWLFIFAIVAGHTCIVFLLPVPGCPKGYLGPGGLAEGGKYFNCTGGATGYIDKLLLGDSHTYGNPTCKEIYSTTLNFDPEGLLGFLPSIVLTFLGLQAGRILFMYKSHTSQISRLLIWAIVMGGIAGGLTLGTLDEGIIPINKNLWSLSFILVMAALSNILFVFCYVTCDIYKLWNGSPFFYCGMNAIMLYIAHNLVRFNIYWHDEPQTHTSYLVVASFGTAVWVAWAYALFKKKLFFTV